ncbi:MAG TPA: biopolymer transporter ExbD [Candidatus Eisenbacteria bacterium]|nr:biopolymer transporter ExbD [Candidatus Eisenbacteria bacterium]
MSRHFRTRTPDGIFEPNMTPLIDVCLVLVVILMVATPMAFQSSISVQKAAAAGKSADLMAKTERVEITILSADSVTVNRAPVSRVQMNMLVRPLLELSSTKTVVIRCADEVPNGAFVNVLDEAKRCGAARIAVVGG